MFFRPRAYFDFMLIVEVAEMILDKKELEFYKWEGDLSKMLQNVREKLNEVASVRSSFLLFFFLVFLSNNIFW